MKTHYFWVFLFLTLAKATLKVLIPEMNKMTEDNKSYESEDLSVSKCYCVIIIV